MEAGARAVCRPLAQAPLFQVGILRELGGAGGALLAFVGLQGRVTQVSSWHVHKDRLPDSLLFTYPGDAPGFFLKLPCGGW
eukprot:987676-Pelagomonas_calceolata.AAC.2